MGYKFKQLIHNIKDFFKYMNKIYLVIFGVLIIALILTISLLSFKNNKEEKPNDTVINQDYNLVLFGPEEVSIYEGDTYQEIGYYATLNNKIVTSLVKVDNPINSNKLGEYIVTYSIDNIVKTRIVNVIEKKNSGVSDIKLEVIGNTEVHLTLGDTYHDAGCQAFDKDNNNISSKIKTTNPVNTNKVGIYYITYSITLDNETKNTKRLVVVHPKENTSGNNQGNGSQGNSNQSGGSYGSTNENNGIKVNTLNISTNYSNTYTKNNITISVSASGDNLAYIKLPNGNKVYGTTTSYEATSNGNYYFYVYDTNNNYNVTTARITTIDKTAPTLTCNATYTGSKTTITVNAKDNSGINYYNYANKYTSALSTFTVNEVLERNNITVTAYDMAGNSKTAKCTTPKSGGNLEIHFIAGISDDDAILIRNNNTTIMIDGGQWGARDKIVSYLKAAGVTTIDALIGSHVHWNHVQSHAAILDNFTVKNTYYSTDPRNCVSLSQCKSDDVKYIKDKLNSKGTPVTILKNSSYLEYGDMKLYFIGPNRKLTTYQNANSLVFILKYLNNTFMFTGDTPYNYMNANTFINNMKYFNIDNIDIDVLKWPHHGYENLNDEFFKATTPKYAIIPNCCWCTSKYPSSNNKSLMKKYGTTYYQVCDSKNIVLISDGNNIEIKTNQKPEDYKR